MGEIFFFSLYFVLPAVVWFVPFFMGIRYWVWSVPSSRARVARGVVLGIVHTFMAVGAVCYLSNQALHAVELAVLLFIPPILAVIGAAFAITMLLLLSLRGRMRIGES